MLDACRAKALEPSGAHEPKGHGALGPLAHITHGPWAHARWSLQSIVYYGDPLVGEAYCLKGIRAFADAGGRINSLVANLAFSCLMVVSRAPL